MQSILRRLSKWLIAGFVLTSFQAYSQTKTPAFPTAEGFGKWATGGRGGEVVIVTNLQDDGVGNIPGSFRWAVQQHSGKPLTVVFQVAGTIDLKGIVLKINRENLTIAGQTAPGDGICLKGATLNLGGSKNVIMRSIRIRVGSNADGSYIPGTPLGYENGGNFIIDHCSLSWSAEELCDFYDDGNQTIQWCIFSEGLYAAGHPKGSRGYGPVVGGHFTSFHHNLMASNATRNPRFGTSDNKGDENMFVDFVNNVSYNYGKSNSCYGGENEMGANGSCHINFVGNYWKPGPAYPGTKTAKMVVASWSANGSGTNPTYFTKYHMSGNYIEGSANTGINTDNYKGLDIQAYIDAVGSSVNINQFKSNRFSTSETVTTHTAKEAYDLVLANAGAFPTRRDAVDARVINEAKTGTVSAKAGSFNQGAVCGIIDNPSQVGGFPTLKSYCTYTDSDKDGIDDNWEKANGMNSSNASDRNTLTKEGYTKLEVYINGLMGEYLTGFNYPSPCATNEATLTKSGSGAASQTVVAGTAITSFVYTWANATSVTVTGLPTGVTSTINTTNKTVTISGTPTTAGTNNYTITTTGGSPNATATGTITVTAAPKPTDCAGVENGTATLDNCDRCIGGTTGKVACTSAGEAEVDACSFDGTVDNNNAGFKGTGFINVPNAIGSEITFHVNATTAGTKTLSFRYASGGTADRAATVNLNGAALATNLSFPATGAFTTYKTTEVSLTLNEGVNIVQLVSTTADGLANIDQIGYVSAGLSKGDCEEVVTNVVKENDAFSLELYPNPSQSSFNIRTSAPLTIEITDAEGKTLKTYRNVSELEFGADLLPGVYFAKVQNKVYKFVKY